MECQELKLDETQDAAIRACLSDKSLIAVTGAAGTGKTTIIKQATEKLNAKGKHVILSAPTGKAARRITEVTGYPALTVHKLLEFPNPGEVDEKTGKPFNQTRPKRHERNPLDYNVIILDEAAMVSRQLYTDLVNAIPLGGRLLMFGDINQLPPIEEGYSKFKNKYSPFFDAIYNVLPNGVFEPKGYILTTIHRQGEGSGIVKNGSNIIKGMFPASYPDFGLIQTKYLIKELEKKIKDADFKSFDNQIIVPGHKGYVGTRALNLLLQDKLNPSWRDNSIALARHKYDTRDVLQVSVGDKVINNKNQYDLGLNGVMNGETGLVTELTEWGDLVVNFNGELVSIPNEIISEFNGVTYSYNPQKDIDLAYAITTHKSQGSEYKNVIYLIDRCHAYIIQRNNFYTAITRAREHVDVIFNSDAMNRALAKEALSFKGKTK